MSEPRKPDEPIQGQLELDDEQLDTAVGGATTPVKGVKDGTSNTVIDGSSNT